MGGQGWTFGCLQVVMPKAWAELGGIGVPPSQLGFVPKLGAMCLGVFISAV